MLKTIDKYLSKLRRTGLLPRFNVYRGQSDSEWPLRSSATRHLSVTQDPPPPNVLISYHKDILMKTRTGGFSIEHGKELSDLQLLAELRHFGTPTGLLDFTWNPLVAMWFASHDNSKDGKLFSINTNNPGNVYQIFGDEANQDISKILSHQFKTERPPVAIWEPAFKSTARNRILVQSSVFVIGLSTFTSHDDIVSEITISKKDKNILRSELHHLYINEQNLFKDIFGFAQTRSFVPIITEHSTKNDYIDNSKLNQGITFFQQREFHSAVYIFDSLIESDSDEVVYYLYRGIANIYLKNYIQAEQDIDEFISIVDGNHLAYYFGSIAKHKLGDFDSAIKYCNRAIDIQPNNVMAYFNRGATMASLGQYEKVISDNHKAIRLEPFLVDPYYNRAYANYKLERYDDAMEDYTKVLQFDTEYLAAYYGRACTYYMLEMYEHAVQDFTHAIELNSDAMAYYGRACTYYTLEMYEHATQDFTHAIELNSEYAEAFLGRAYANKELGRSRIYEKDLQIAYQLKPQLAE